MAKKFRTCDGEASSKNLLQAVGFGYLEEFLKYFMSSLMLMKRKTNSSGICIVEHIYNNLMPREFLAPLMLFYCAKLMLGLDPCHAPCDPCGLWL